LGRDNFLWKLIICNRKIPCNLNEEQSETFSPQREHQAIMHERTL